MGKKCPPGVICIENFAFLFFGLIIFAILYFMYLKYILNKNNNICCNNSLSCNCNNNNNNSNNNDNSNDYHNHNDNDNDNENNSKY